MQEKPLEVGPQRIFRQLNCGQELCVALRMRLVMAQLETIVLLSRRVPH